MTSPVLSGVTKRRAELAGEADTLRSRLAQIGTDVGNLDAVTWQFDPDYDLGSIRPKRPRGPDAAGRGERSRALLGVLREAMEPLTAAEITLRMMAQQKQDAEISGSCGRPRSGLRRRWRGRSGVESCGRSGRPVVGQFDLESRLHSYKALERRHSIVS